MSVLLETDRLRLRRFVPADLEHLVELDSDPEVMRFLSGGRPTPRALIESEILPRFIRYDVPMNGCGHWAADEKETGEFIGWFGLQARDSTADELELGFRLRRPSWRKGYASEGGRALIRWAFDTVGVARVVAITYQGNVASQRVLERLGLRLVRRFRMTDDELAAIGTYDASSGEVWAGDDLEYALEKGAGRVTSQNDPHASAPVLSAGVPLTDAEVAVVLVHGRGARAEEMLAFARGFETAGAALLAPQADGMQWYPHSFLVPLADNEPWLSSALGLLERIIDAVERDGPGRARAVLVGFSQGACLLLEFVARHAMRCGGVAGLSGGLIGPPGTPRDYDGSLDGMPVFLGCSDVDPHIPAGRVEETASVLESMGAEVTMRLYPGMGHTVNDDEITEVQRLVERTRG